MKILQHLLLVASLQLSHSALASSDDLPECEFDTQVQFYNVDIDVLNLPENCRDPDLINIGFITQDVVDETEEKMPDYREEYMSTLVCPFPDEVAEGRRRRRRQLDTIAMRHLQTTTTRTRRYRFRGTGRCRRCRRNNNARMLEDVSDGRICSIANQVESLYDKANYAAVTAESILTRMTERANSVVFNGTDTSRTRLETAREYAMSITNNANMAFKVSESVATLCVASTKLRSSTALLLEKAKQEHARTTIATDNATESLTSMRKILFEMDTLYHYTLASSSQGQRRELWRRFRRKIRNPSSPSSSSESGSSSGSGSYTPGPFGVSNLILVDADTSTDIATIGSPECEPMNKCFNGATLFNIRAETFGNVKSVYLKSDGPIREPGRKEGIAPYSVWGDDGKGDFTRHELKEGTYTITAQAADRRGNKSSMFTKTFTVAPSSLTVAASAPDPTPSPATSLTAAPTASPTVSPTPDPTSRPSLSPTEETPEPTTEFPSSSPTRETPEPTAESPSSYPTNHPTTAPTASPSLMPSKEPETPAPTALPSKVPTDPPTMIPTSSPSSMPTETQETPEPTEFPTAMPSSSPTTAVSEAPSLTPTTPIELAAILSDLPRTREMDYLSRLTSNLDSGNTECEEVKQAMILKTLAEETAIAGDDTYDKIFEIARGYEGNADVERIKKKAKASNDKVHNEAAKACAAAELASDLCEAARRRLLDGKQKQIHEEVEVASAAVLESRLALSETKTAKNEMKEAVDLIEFDPKMSQLEANVEQDVAALVEHLDNVEAAITEVEAQLQALPDETTPEASALKTKLESLVKEEKQIEEVLANDEQFLVSQSALKKEEMYQSTAPNFKQSPPLQYVETSSSPENGLPKGDTALLQYLLRSRTSEENIDKQANWDAADETAGSKEEWFRRFGDRLVADLETRLFLSYSTNVGGCIGEDSDLSIVVIVTELATLWEQFDPVVCSTAFLARPNRAPGRPDEGQESSAAIDGAQVEQSPSGSPSIAASSAPSTIPSLEPTIKESMLPSNEPSLQPSGRPSAASSSPPSNLVTASPSSYPSELPTTVESSSPSSTPSLEPSVKSSSFPSDMPSVQPSHRSSSTPSLTPSSSPTDASSESPSQTPSQIPSASPSTSTSNAPTVSQSDQPSALPSAIPTFQPSATPSLLPSIAGSSSPTIAASNYPSLLPPDNPSSIPSETPTASESVVPSSLLSTPPSGTSSDVPSLSPTSMPSKISSELPSLLPSTAPTDSPSKEPTESPSLMPSNPPSATTTANPSTIPSASPSTSTSNAPTVSQSAHPSAHPSAIPTGQPSDTPSLSPSIADSSSPTIAASNYPSLLPSYSPSSVPSGIPTASESAVPSSLPSTPPSRTNSDVPSYLPSHIPSGRPSELPSSLPSTAPTDAPTMEPTESPSLMPSNPPSAPTANPSTTLSASANASPVTLTRTTLQDAYVRDGRSIDRTLGVTDPIKLDVKLTNRDDANRRSFLQFDLSGIDGVVSQAKILLKVYGARDVPVVHNLHAVSDNSWDEQQITWNTMPALGPVLDTVTVPIEPVAEGNYMEYNVTTHVNNLVAQKQSLASFAIAADPKKSVDLLIKYYSKEAGPNDQPIFEVTFDPSAQIIKAAASSVPCPATTTGPVPVGGRAIWSSVTRAKSGTPYYREFDGSRFTPDTKRGANAIFRYSFGSGAASPVCYDQMFVGITANQKVSGTRFDGSVWNSISMDKTNVLGTVSDTNTWNNIAGAYESQSGRAIVVYNKNGTAASPRYSVWDGTSNGVWPNSKEVDPNYIGGEPQWFDIVSNPLSDELVLVFSDDASRIFVSVWGGSTWSHIMEIGQGLYQAGVGVAYQALSGDAMVVYGKTTMDNVYYRIWNGSQWSQETVAFALGTKSSINWVSLRSDPQSNRLVLGFVMSNGCSWLSIWNGKSWEATRKGFCNLSGADRPALSVAVESKSGDALVVFGLAGNPKILYLTLSNGTEKWSTEMTAGIGEDTMNTMVTSSSLALYSNPDVTSNQIMLMALYENKSLYAVPWNGANDGRWATELFPQLDSDTGQSVNQPFTFVWNPT